jgi:adenosine deaminase
MKFSDLSSFIAVARINNQALQTIDDYCDLARQYLKRVHDENVVQVQVAVSPQGFRRRGLEIKPCIEALASAFLEALDNFGMTGGIIAGCRRDLPPDEALEMLHELRACGDAILRRPAWRRMAK